jgi:hypothetical protein
MSTLRTDSLVNRAGTGAPSLTQGAVVPTGKSISGAGSIDITGDIKGASIRSNSILDNAGTGAPVFTEGASVPIGKTISGEGNINITGDIAGSTLTLSGNDSSTVNEATVSVDASVSQLHSRIASFSTAVTLQVANLTSGRTVQIYMRNTNATARVVTVQASETTSGFANVNLAVSTTAGSASAVSVSLALTSGTAVIWLANIDGDIVGSVV